MSVDIHVIEIITWNLPDVWHMFFSSDPLNILICEKTGIGYKSIVKLKFSCTSYASNISYEMLYLSWN